MGLPISPPPITEDQGSFAWQQWYMSLSNLYATEGSIPWSVLDFTGSSITDLADRLHNSLQSIQGGTSGEYYHLTSAEYTAFQALTVFKTISVSGQSDVVADSITDTLTLAAGTGITLTTNASTDTITITGSNSFGTVSVSGQSDVVADQVNDVLTLVAGTGITITTNAGTDSVTITGSNSFGTVAVSGQSDVVADSVNDTLTLAAGTGITITTNAGTDTVTISGTATINSFQTISVSGQSDVVADSSTDTLTLVGSGTVITTNASTDTITFTTSGGDTTGNLGYLNIPANSQSANYTTVLGDAGKHILHPSSDNNARDFTIAANASVAYPVGTAITFVNKINTVTIKINSDTLTLAGAGSTGNRTLAANGMATALKIATTEWMISGAGLT